MLCDTCQEIFRSARDLDQLNEDGNHELYIVTTTLLRLNDGVKNNCQICARLVRGLSAYSSKNPSLHNNQEFDITYQLYDYSYGEHCNISLQFNYATLLEYYLKHFTISIVSKEDDGMLCETHNSAHANISRP
jgi:hypothetical protein